MNNFPIIPCWKRGWLDESEIFALSTFHESCLWIRPPQSLSRRIPSCLLSNKALLLRSSITFGSTSVCHFVPLPFWVTLYIASMPPLMWSVTWQWSSQLPGYWGRIFTVWKRSAHLIPYKHEVTKEESLPTAWRSAFCFSHKENCI